MMPIRLARECQIYITIWGAQPYLVNPKMPASISSAMISHGSHRTARFQVLHAAFAPSGSG